jgi:serine/threonine-protein kinase
MSSSEVDSGGEGLVADRRQFGRYTLCYRVAQGGMASVYLALVAAAERSFQKWVAVKVIHPQFATDKKFAAMFLNEARLAAQLRHPNICDILDFGQSDNAYFIAMEYLHGESLGAVLKRARREAGVPLALGARIVSDAARGLHAAHELRAPDGSCAEVVHRDVSPQNIFVLYEGMAMVVDFGIALSRDRLVERTATGELRGKIAYMAPEQLGQKPIDRRADVFALGVVLWELTLGRRLFKRATEVDTLVAAMSAPIPRPSELSPNYPASLEQIVMRALARDPAERFATAGEMGRELDRYIASTGEPCGPPEVADFMKALFRDRIEERERLLGHVAHGPVVAEIELQTPSPDAARLPARPSMATMRLQPVTGDAETLAGPRPRRRLVQMATAVAGVLALVAGALFALERGTPSPRPLPPALVSTLPAAHVPPPRTESVPDAALSPLDAHVPAALADATAAAVLADAAATDVVDPEARRLRRAARARGEGGVRNSAPGFLNMFAIPTATVFEGTRSLGFTPLVRRELAAGRHVFRLVPVDGRPARTVVVEIRPGEARNESVRW